MTAEAPDPTLDELLDQERRLVFPSLDEDDAVALGLSLLSKATDRGLAVTIEVRLGERIVFRAARTGTDATNDLYIAGKARIVERFGHSSLYERLQYEVAGTSFAEATSLEFPEYAPHGGGFPLIVADRGPVGVVIVSGLPQLDDHALVVECLTELSHVAVRLRGFDPFRTAPTDACYTRPMVDVSGPTGPGIRWEPGDEDYPFAAMPGESALDYLRRWLDSAGYARVEQDGVRYVHEEDVANLFNHVTADVDLLRARLATFGDHVLVASDHAMTIARVESAIAELRAVLDTLQPTEG